MGGACAPSAPPVPSTLIHDQKRKSKYSESFGRMFLYVDFIDTVDKIVKAI